MRFSLQDVKKQVHRRGGELYVGLHFLRPDELHAEIEKLVAYHENLLRQPKRQFSQDEARACVGDYRLADCLIATLSAWYTWRQCDWTEVTGLLPADPLLRAAEITSPTRLRLALFNYVNEQYHGFLDGEQRTQALQAFCDPFQLSLPDLEYLLVMDSDEEALLLRDSSQAPTSQEVATRYNQWVFEAALSNASQVHFVIDCQAFGGTRQEDLSGRQVVAAGVGAVIKRLCYLARLLGVYYDLAYQDGGTLAVATAGSQRDGRDLRLSLTLYGPQEMTGVPQQYGLRLARLCRLLLGYGLSAREVDGKRRGIRKETLSGGILAAEATVHFLQRAYCFMIDANVLALINGADSPAREEPRPVVAEASGLYDSSIEQSFAEAFRALESSQAVDGWRLEREPEPLLLEQGIFIPDFALTRARRRIYVEILGFWTPAYRERKIRKLQQLRERDDILLAIPQEARDAFSNIATSFPIVWYDGQLSATELLSTLRSHYDDFAGRLASIDIGAVRQRVRREHLLLERACYELLSCYRRSELQRASESIAGDDIGYIVGVGLYQVDWLEHLHHSFVEWLSGVRSLPLPTVLREVRERWPALAQCEEATLETLLSLWPEVRVQRSSIFEALVEHSEAGQIDGVEEEAQPALPVDRASIQGTKRPGRIRERRVVQKKQGASETTQGDLWGVP
ncbi:MAG: DUF790 family protein [Ktedonobacteraceae bacterium]|nr:DUF790 family protein [Ktedonobacteraceae bacterium]